MFVSLAHERLHTETCVLATEASPIQQSVRWET